LAAIAKQRNPFGASLEASQKLLDEEKQKREEAEAVELAEATPEEAGFVLSSTLVGKARKTALINGRVYEEGSQIASAGGVVFRLTQVEPQRVVLEREGHVYPLEIKRRSGSGRMEIRSFDP